MSPTHKLFNTNHSFLINHFQKLGKYCRSVWYGPKDFILFDKSGDLKIVQINLIQRIARKLFGCYQETHLKNVVLNWNTYQAKHGCISPEFNEKLLTLWAKHHSESILMPPPNEFLFGNSNLRDAEVIGICQLFSDPNNSKFCGKILSEYYQEEDVILIEGVDANVKISSSQDMQTAFLSKPAEIYGWEPKGYAAQRDNLFETTIAIENQFQSNLSILLRLLNNINFLENLSEFQFKVAQKESPIGPDRSPTNSEPKLSQLSPVDKEKLWQKVLHTTMENFLNSLKKIEERFVDKNLSSAKDSELDSLFISAFQEFQKNYQFFLQTSKNKEDCNLFITELKKIYDQSNKCLQKRKYTRNWTVEQDLFFKNTWTARQESLCNEIERYRKQNKRVFVCAGSAHFFPNRGKSHSEVLATLINHKFCLAISNIPQNATYYSFEELSRKISTA